MFRTILLFEGPSEIRIRRSREGSESLDYELCKSELLEALGNLEDADSLVLLARYLRSMEEPDEDDGAEEGSD
jgi:hypothetical protein